MLFAVSLLAAAAENNLGTHKLRCVTIFLTIVGTVRRLLALGSDVNAVDKVRQPSHFTRSQV